MSRPLRRARENLTEIVSVLVTGIWLAALFTGQGWWLPFMLVGYVVLVPLTALLFGDEKEEMSEWWRDEAESRSRSARQRSPSREPSPGHRSSSNRNSTGEEPLQILRERYASGELTEQEFEEKVERLLETEDIERSASTGDPIDRELERERE